MTTTKLLIPAVSALALFAAAAPASAQTHHLPYVQAGVSLDYAESEVRILYAAVTARQFDLGLTKQTLEEVKEGLRDAKVALDRAETLLPEKLAGRSEAVLAVRERVVTAEAQVEKLAEAIVEQTRVLTEEEEDVEDLPPTDWKLLERQTGWLAVDVAAARTAHGRLGPALKARMPKKVPRPRGKRAEL